MSKVKIKIANLVNPFMPNEFNPMLDSLLAKKFKNGGLVYDRDKMVKEVAQEFQNYEKLRQDNLTENSEESTCFNYYPNQQAGETFGSDKKTKRKVKDFILNESNKVIYGIGDNNTAIILDNSNNPVLDEKGLPKVNEDVYRIDGKLKDGYKIVSIETNEFNVLEDKIKDIQKFLNELLDKDIELNCFPLSMSKIENENGIDLSDINFNFLEPFVYDDRKR